jgi:S-adenosylmethionine:tRNA ribosyltransferase-isomerase
MKTDDFNYDLDESLIAQVPIENRDESKLMILDKNNGDIDHKKFRDIIDYLDKGDVLVLNDTKVIPARLIGHKEDTGAVIEVLLLKDTGDNIWQALTRPQKRVKIGSIISFGDGRLKCKCVSKEDMGICHFKLIYNGILPEILDSLGEMPLPPYIHEKLQDKNMYQTVYAKNPGSAAAPTAGLHFTPELLEKIKEKGVELIYVTLNVGLGTFRPVTEDDPTKHPMHSELYDISKEAAERLNLAKKNGKRIISVGTTSTRTLESAIHDDGLFYPECKETSIFIYPGYKFKAIDALITNFHLPKSTLIMLVSALAGREFILEAYNKAVEEKYRFFSFGDAMFIE